MDSKQYIDTEKNLVYKKVTGELTLNEVKASIAQLATAPSYRREMPVLLDLRGVTKFLSTEETAQLAEFVKSNPGLVSPARRALLVESELAYGMYRMFEAFTAGGAAEYCVFRDESEARAWVEEAAVPAKK